jgi:photosystem II stability/assembly factor-like uncharacterized protein
VISATQFRLLRFAAIALVLGALACDDDPASPDIERLTAVGPDDAIIGRQSPIRVAFNRGLDPRSALDPSNFIVINQCNGLRVPGSLRLAGDTVIFSPSTALPFLVPLSIRVQNVLDTLGNALENPFTFTLTTESPPVTDVSWELLGSPTNDAGSGIFFVNRDLGFLSTITGALYRTDNGGLTFAALFKSAIYSTTRNVRAVDANTIYMTGSVSAPGTFTRHSILRSTNGGLTFAELVVADPADMRSLSLVKNPASHTLFAVGNQSGSLATWRYDSHNGATAVAVGFAGLPAGRGGDISRDTTKAVAVGRLGDGRGVAYRSTDGGRTFVPITFASSVPAFGGADFIDNTSALLLGDSSTVIRVNVATGQPTVLGAAQGIPQTQVDLVEQTSTVFHFTEADFAPNNPLIGWIIGVVVTRRGVEPEIRRGIILMTRDGGQNFVRQAVQGAPDLGLGFASLGEVGRHDVQALASDFVSITGANGFVSARKADIQVSAQVCSFDTPDE